MPFSLQLYEDLLPAGAAARCAGAGSRMLYVAAGALTVSRERLSADAGAFSAGPCDVQAGPGGAAVWRFELTDGTQRDLSLPGVRSQLRLAAPITTVDLAAGDRCIMRLDSVAFPPGGCALLHTHQGPGIRCLVEGTIRIDTEGQSTSYGPGGAWFEGGPEPVFAQADPGVPSRFVRTMVLPGRLRGRSSIQYVRAEDRDAPKSQQYRVYVERVLQPAPAGWVTSR